MVVYLGLASMLALLAGLPQYFPAKPCVPPFCSSYTNFRPMKKPGISLLCCFLWDWALPCITFVSYFADLKIASTGQNPCTHLSSLDLTMRQEGFEEFYVLAFSLSTGCSGTVPNFSCQGMIQVGYLVPLFDVIIIFHSWTGLRQALLKRKHLNKTFQPCVCFVAVGFGLHHVVTLWCIHKLLC